MYLTFYPLPLRILPLIICPPYWTECVLSAPMLSKLTSVPGNSSATQHTTSFSSRHLLFKTPSRRIISQVNQPYRNNKPFSKYSLFTIQVTNICSTNFINSQSNPHSGMRKPSNLQDTSNQGWYCLTNRLSTPMHPPLIKQHRLQPPHLRTGKWSSSILPTSTTLTPLCQPTNNLTHPNHANQLNNLHQTSPLQTPKRSLNYAPTSLTYHILLYTYLFQNYPCNKNRSVQRPLGTDSGGEC